MTPFSVTCLIFLLVNPPHPEPRLDFEFRVQNCRECSDLLSLYRSLGYSGWRECFRESWPARGRP